MIEQEVSFEHFADMAPFKGDQAASVLLSLHQERAWEEDLAQLIPKRLGARAFKSMGENRYH